MITKTTIQTDTNSILISRLIKYKLHTITFNVDVKANDVIPYFNIPDDKFMLLSGK